jgi:hypothetical protein
MTTQTNNKEIELIKELNKIEKENKKFYCECCFRKEHILKEIDRFRKKAVMGICEDCEKKYFNNKVENIRGLRL